MRIVDFFKDLIAPKKCYSCHKEGLFLCKECLEEIGYFESICPVCKQSSRNFEVHFYCKNDFVYFDKVIILNHYKNKIIKKLIKDAKFYHRKDILQDLSIYLGNKLLSSIDEKNDEIVLISIPMFFWKKMLRGYNQSEVLIKSLADKFNIKYNFKIIKKIKSTKPQSHLSKIERLENLQNVFIFNKKELQKYKHKTFIIVDDVVSTGTTLNEIAKLLKQNGVKKIYGLCLASD
ncbi:MAG: phosphoribosyltransferase family protein [Candidatus Gracilibacteria bacterium]|nr:phosphoribosyltransferase family protein [Candidatus Gracilibacteria bacterium]